MKKIICILSLSVIVTSCGLDLFGSASLNKVKIKAHDAVSFTALKTLSNTDEYKDLKCEGLSAAPSYFEAFEPKFAEAATCTFDGEVLHGVLPTIETRYLVKDSNGKYSEFNSESEALKSIDSEKEALAFALYSNPELYAVNNIVSAEKLLNEHSLYNENKFQFFNIDKFKIKSGLAVKETNIEETHIVKDADAYIINLFYYYLNNNADANRSCTPELWQYKLKVSKDAKIDIIEKTLLIKDGDVPDCLGPVA